MSTNIPRRHDRIIIDGDDYVGVPITADPPEEDLPPMDVPIVDIGDWPEVEIGKDGKPRYRPSGTSPPA